MITKMLLFLHRALYFPKCSQAHCSHEAIIPILEMRTPNRGGYLNSKEVPSEVKVELMRNSL